MENEVFLSKNKKIIYFLMACNDKQTVKFLKYSFLIQKNRKFPVAFVKKSKSIFENNRKYLVRIENNFFSPWRYFCKTATYEEVLLVILYGVLKFPTEKLSWSLNIPPETISYRVNQGLYLLGEKLFNKSSEERYFQNQNNKIEGNSAKEKALTYCQELEKICLPIEIEKIKFNKNNIKTKYLFRIVIFFIVIPFIIWLFSLLFSAPKTMILYQSFSNRIKYNNLSS